MKLLTVAFLLAGAASLTSSFAAGQGITPPYTRNNFCPTGNLTNSHNTIALNTPGQIYYADQCYISASALVNLYAQEAPLLPSNLQGALAELTAPSRITASVTRTTFAAGSQVLVCMPVIAKAATTCPVHVYVQNNEFLANAVIRFYGSYPPNSKLVITGNRLHGVSELSRYPTMGSQVAGILGWQSNTDFYMKENSHIEISHNVVKVSNSVPNAAKKYELRGIGIWNYVYMQKNCSIAVNSNTVTVNGVQGIFNGGMDAFAYIAEGPDTKYEMINNTFSVANGFAIGCPFARYPSSAEEEMRHSTNVLVTRNSGTVYSAVYFPTSKSNGDVIYVGNSKNSLDSVIEISHNKFDVKGSDGNIRVAETELRDNAAVKVLANTLTTVGGGPRIIFSWNMSAYNESRVYALHNTLARENPNDFTGSFFLYYRGFSLYNNSEAHLSQNTFTAQSANKKALLLDRYPEMPFNVYNDQCFKMCANDFYGTDLNTDALVNETLPAYVSPYVASQAYCPAEPFPFPDLPAIPAAAALFDPLSDGETTATTEDPAVTVVPPTPTANPNATTHSNGCAGDSCSSTTLAVMAAATAAAIASLLM